MAIPLNDNIRINAGKPSESKYLNLGGASYTGTSQVISQINISERHIGLTVNINNIEYWFENGVTDGDIVIKSASGTVTGATNGLSVSGANIELGGSTLRDGDTIIEGSTGDSILNIGYFNSLNTFNLNVKGTIQEVVNNGSFTSVRQQQANDFQIFMYDSGFTSNSGIQLSPTNSILNSKNVGSIIKTSAEIRSSAVGTPPSNGAGTKLEWTIPLNDTGNPGLSSNAGISYIGVDNSTPTVEAKFAFEIHTGGTQFSVGRILEIDKNGAKYIKDNSANFDKYSLVDVNYVTGFTGGGSITGGTNGLTTSGSTIILGGILTSDVFTDGAFTLAYGFLSDPLTTFAAKADFLTLTNSGNTAELTIDNDSVRLSRQSHGLLVETDTLTLNSVESLLFFDDVNNESYFSTSHPGALKYAANYSSTFVPRSLVDKSFVTGLTSSITVSANNGLIKKIGNNIGLGGTLTGATTITSPATGSRLNFAGFPIQYATNLSASYNPRSIPDVAFVTGLTSASITSANNGLSKIGNNIRLGGSPLTGDTFIDTQNTYGILINDGGTFPVQIFPDTFRIGGNVVGGESGIQFTPSGFNMAVQGETSITTYDGGNLNFSSNAYMTFVASSDIQFNSSTVFSGPRLDSTSNVGEFWVATDTIGNGTFSGVTFSSTNANNGLTKRVGNNIGLGGSLTGNTTITMATGSRLSFAGYPVQYATNLSASYNSRSVPDTAYVTGITSQLIAIANNGLNKIGTNVRLGGSLTGATTITSPATGSRLSFSGFPVQYIADYSANYNSRSFVDKGYVTGITSSFTANNGLNKIGTNFRLGGTLTGDTTIDGSGHTLTLIGNEIYLNNALGRSSVGIRNGIGVELVSTNDESILINSVNGGLVDLVTGGPSTGGIRLRQVNTNETVTFGEVDSSGGLIYGGNYSPNFLPRSLVDKAYVDSIITGSTITASNGLTKIGNDIQLGGTITGFTFIDIGTNTYWVSGNDGFGNNGGMFMNNLSQNTNYVNSSGDTISLLIDPILPTYLARLISNIATEFKLEVGIDNVQLFVTDNNENIQTYIKVMDEVIQVSSGGVSGSTGFTGIQYGHDYSVNFTSRSIPDVEWVLDQIISGTSIITQVVTASTTIASNINITFVISSGGTITVTLPATPTNGQQITVKDVTGNANTNNITINGNGKNIDGSPTSLINTNFGASIFTYSIILDGWFITGFVN